MGDAGAGSSLSDRGTGMAGDENGRRRHLMLAQPCDEIESCHLGQVLVDDQAAVVKDRTFDQQVPRAWVGADRGSLDLEQELERIANGHIVIDDDNDGGPSAKITMFFHHPGHAEAPNGQPFTA